MQAWYKTNLGYYATKKRILQSNIIGSCHESKGRFTFHLKDFKDITFQITSKQLKLGITYPKEIEYNYCLERVKPLLVKADGTPAEIDEMTYWTEKVESKEDLREKLKRLEREKRILELERKFLPKVVLEKMVGKEKARTFKNYFEDNRTIEDLPYDLREIEIKTVSPQEFALKYLFSSWKVLKRDTKMIWDEKYDGSDQTGHEEGTITIGIYKALLKFYDEQFKANWLNWKKEYGLDDETWTEIRVTIREMMEDNCLPVQIDNFIVDHILSKTPEGQERLESVQKWWDSKLKALTTDELRKYIKLARKKSS